jgi:hypothetical protein
MGIEIFSTLDPEASLVVATAGWQYTHHVLPGLRTHRGPILTVANWSGQWPGLVGLLNLNGSLVKAGVSFSSLWSDNFEDAWFLQGLGEWIRNGHVNHDTSLVRDLSFDDLPASAGRLGMELATDLLRRKAILGSSTKAAWACITQSSMTSC